jgi:cell division protein FtsB
MKKNFHQIFGSLPVVILLGLTLSYMGYGQVQNWLKKRSINHEIEQLTQQAENLEQKNSQISESLAFLNSQNYKEKIAREQLNLKKDGELVFDTAVNPNYSSQTKDEGFAEEATVSNPRKWYNFFFSN